MLKRRLAEIIKEKNISMNKLSKLSGIRMSTLQKYINTDVKRVYFSILKCDNNDLFSV